ncbi:MAG: phosphoribosyltransferase [bacterium]|nr:phosphoribosyltransferase [bacterium]
MPKTSTQREIRDFIIQNGPVTRKQILDAFPIYHTMVHRHLKHLIEKKEIIKIGKTPKVFYKQAESIEQTSDSTILENQAIEYLNQHYYNYDSDGQVLSGYEGFQKRCKQRSLDIAEQYEQFNIFSQNIQKLKNKQGLINGFKYLSPKLGEIYVDKLFFIDAYQVGQFGRSKLGSMTFYAKQSQNKKLIQEVVKQIKYPILSYIQQNQIDGIAFAPPSIKRGVQLLTEIKKELSLPLTEIKLQKIFPTEIIIPQKSLRSMEQRKKNAQNTIFVTAGQEKVKNLLLIDDFIGSGATINFCAQKIKNAKLSEEIHAICLLGNIDTKYDVINEV